MEGSIPKKEWNSHTQRDYNLTKHFANEMYVNRGKDGQNRE
jgi:hypothetical protein